MYEKKRYYIIGFIISICFALFWFGYFSTKLYNNHGAIDGVGAKQQQIINNNREIRKGIDASLEYNQRASEIARETAKRIETVQRDHGTAREIIERNAEIYKQIRTQKE